MKVIIEAWQSSDDGKWHCNLSTSSGDFNATEGWDVENFCDLLRLIGEKIPDARCGPRENK